jgi:hypothetical protein
MRRVRYGFGKKNPSTRARRTRLPAVPVPAVPAARRECTRPVPAVPTGKPLVGTKWYTDKTMLGG